jgi:hypothetical protein
LLGTVWANSDAHEMTEETTTAANTRHVMAVILGHQATRPSGNLDYFFFGL